MDCTSRVILKIFFQINEHCVKGRWIRENTVIAQKVVHKVRKYKSKNGLMVMKMDLRKAYDRMEWRFIDKALSAWGFSTDFRQLATSCINIVEMGESVITSSQVEVYVNETFCYLSCSSLIRIPISFAFTKRHQQ